MGLLTNAEKHRAWNRLKRGNHSPVVVGMCRTNRGDIIHLVTSYKAVAQSARQMGMAGLALVAERAYRYVERGILTTRTEVEIFLNRELAKQKETT